MNKLAELKKRLAELKADGNKIVEAAEAAGGDFTDEQEARFSAIEADIETVTADIEKQEKLDARRRTMQAARSTAPGAGDAVPAGHYATNEEDPALTGGFKSLGEFAVAVHGAVNVGRVGGAIDDRLVGLTNSHSGGGSGGEGYSLPPKWRDEAFDLMVEFDEFGGLIDEEPTDSREVKLMADETTPWGTGGIKSYWRAEEQQMTASKMVGEGRNVPLHELYTLAIATEELLEDAQRLQSRLTRKAAMAMSWKKNSAIVEGTGVGQPLGWMKSGALVTVAKESSQSADTITATNVLKMYSRLMRVPGDSPFWLVNQDALPQLATMVIGDRPIYQPASGLASAPFGTLMGLPVRFSEFANTVGDLGDIQLISPKGYYGVRRSSGVKFASSIHLYFDYNAQAFRWVQRFGGQPHLSAPVSPNKGSATRSHFVTLAARA